jgi:DNA invertase Pin-like site-specific DNA recombinase
MIQNLFKGLSNQIEAIAYIRVSTEGQNYGSQKLKIENYAKDKNIKIVDTITVKMSSLKNEQDRKLDELNEKLKKTPVLIITDFSRLGRKSKEFLDNIDKLLKDGIRVISIIENIDLYQGARDYKNNSEIFIYFYAMMNNIQRNVISEKSKDGVAAARLRGKVPGRPKGCIPRSKFDIYVEETKE